MDSSYANGANTRTPLRKVIARRLSGLLLAMMVAVLGFVPYGGDVYAEGEDESTSGFFNIYAYYESVRYDEAGNEVAGSFTHSIVNSAKVTVQNDAVSIEEEKQSDQIIIRIDGDQLKIEPNCAMFNNCPNGISVKINKDVNVLRRDVNGAMTNQTWRVNQAPAGGGSYVEERYTFSSSDVTRLDKVEAPADNLDGSTNSPPAEANCMNSGAMDTLGWVLCPALSLMSGASQWLYDEAIEPALQVEPKLFTDSDGTMNGWEVFRNIANGFFILLLLVVIFSQITGVGIDNYGIKEILPKLIVAAILMNLSYWICTAFVDLSNIIGNSLQRLFTELGRGLTPPSDIGGVSLSSIGTTLSTSVALLAALFAGIWSSGIGEAGIMGVGLTLVVSAISIIVALFFLFVLLAAREAAVVVLLVISPLAFACYILPNTKKLFDRWWKLGSGLLLVYPICGLLVGGGDFVSKLLLSSGVGAGGFFTAFVAMVAGIAPIFFIPTVLRNSFSAMGNLGARISNMGRTVGNRLSSGADRGVRNTERFKNYQADRERQRKIESARRTASRYVDENGNIRPNLSARQQREYTQAQSMLLNEQAEESRRANLLQGGFEAAQAGIVANAEAEAVKNEEALIMSDAGMRDNVGALGSGLERAITSGNENQIRAYQNILSRKGDVGREAVRQAMVNAQGSGEVSPEAMQAYASNLMNNWASDYKDNNRSTFDWAGDVLGGQGGALSQKNADIGKLKTSQIANMDDEEFKRIVAANTDANGNVNPDFARLCYNTLQDANATTSAKDSRMQDIRRIAQGSQEHQQHVAQQQVAQQAQQQQQQMAQNLQDINNLLRHNNGGGGSGGSGSGTS